MNDPLIHAALVNLVVIGITAIGIFITAGFAWAKAKIDALTKQIEVNTPMIVDTEKRVSSLENGGTKKQVNEILAGHGLIERRETDATTNGRNDSTSSSSGTS